MKSLFSLASLCLALTLGAGPAAAATVTYDFTVSGNAGSGSGSFQYDDEKGGTNPFAVLGELEFALTAFSFEFEGNSYDLDDLSNGVAIVDAATGNLLGLDADEATQAFSLRPAIGQSHAFLATRTQSSTMSFTLDDGGGNTVPEPASFGLALAATGLAVGLRRRRRA